MDVKGYIKLPILFAKTEELDAWEKSWEVYEEANDKHKELTGNDLPNRVKPSEDPPSEEGIFYANEANIVGFNKDDEGLTVLSLQDGRKQQFQIKLEEFIKLLNK